MLVTSLSTRNVMARRKLAVKLPTAEGRARGPLPILTRQRAIYTRFQNYATLRENRLRSNVSFMSYLLLKIANVNKRDFILYLSKETNIEANEGRFTNENKLQTFSSEIYIMNHFQTRKKNNLVDLNYI